MATSVSHPISTRNSNISQRAEAQSADIGPGLICVWYIFWHVFFLLYIWIDYIFVGKKMSSLILVFQNRKRRIFDGQMYCHAICEICSRHCSNRRYASIKRIRSEVIRIKSAKVFLKAVHVIKGVIKRCKNLVFYTKYVIKKISLKILNIQNKHDIGWKIRSNYSNVHLIYAKKDKGC